MFLHPWTQINWNLAITSVFCCIHEPFWHTSYNRDPSRSVTSGKISASATFFFFRLIYRGEIYSLEEARWAHVEADCLPVRVTYTHVKPHSRLYLLHKSGSIVEVDDSNSTFSGSVYLAEWRSREIWTLGKLPDCRVIDDFVEIWNWEKTYIGLVYAVRLKIYKLRHRPEVCHLRNLREA